MTIRTQTIGDRVRRREDPRLVTGEALFTPDIPLADALHLALVRSPYPHAEITGIDTEDAAAAPGVVGVFTPADVLPTLKKPFPVARAPDSGAFAELHLPPRSALADGRTRNVGDPVVAVVAETPGQAADAAELVVVDYRDLPGAGDSRTARAEGAERLYPEVAGNRSFVWDLHPDGAPEAARGEVGLSLDFRIQRLIPSAMEPRAVAARVDDGRITMWTSTQVPHRVKATVARILGIPEEQIRTIAPEVGGGFGAKGNLYPEEVLVPWLALRLGRPVRWSATRTEDFQTTSHGRNLFVTLDVAADGDGRVRHAGVDVLYDSGAYFSRPGPTTPSLTGVMIGGPYDIRSAHARAEGAFTNTAPNEPYRGSGRPEATYLIERALDVLAGRLGVDPAAIRRRNLIPPHKFPYRTATGLTYDSGEYEKALDLALEAGDYAGLRAEQARRRAEGGGKLLGVGLACYVEICGFGPWEAGGVTVEPDGSVTVRSGTSPHGQGHETAWAQIAAEQLGVPLDAVTVLHGDTDECPRGIGTFGSRSAPVGGAAVFNNAETVREKAKELAARLLEAAVEDIRFEDGQFFVAGSPARARGWQEIAAFAYGTDAPDDAAANLTADVDFKPPGETFPFGTHLCAVEIEPDTGEVAIVRYISVDDCGRVINPLLAEGQVHGGLAQGISQALFEDAVYDEDGNLLTASLLEYAVPRADMLPKYELHRTVTPTPINPLGVKGIGEAATIGSTPAVANAVLDALRPFGVEHLDTPLTPEKIWRALCAGLGPTGLSEESREGREVHPENRRAEAQMMLTPTPRTQLDFWEGFHRYATMNAKRISPTKPQADTWMDMAVGRNFFRLAAFATTLNWDDEPEPEIRAALWVDGPNAERNYELLKKERDTIHAEFGADLDWITKPGVNLRTIHLRRAVDWREPDAREDCYRWLVEKLDRLHEVFQPRIQELP